MNNGAKGSPPSHRKIAGGRVESTEIDLDGPLDPAVIILDGPEPSSRREAKPYPGWRRRAGSQGPEARFKKPPLYYD